jgi:hypothetical protein
VRLRSIALSSLMALGLISAGSAPAFATLGSLVPTPPPLPPEITRLEPTPVSDLHDSAYAKVLDIHKEITDGLDEIG